MRYMGSKSRVAKHIVPVLQGIIDKEDIRTYIEPFCGGCNIIDKIRCSSKIANDKQLYLIELLKNGERVKELPDEVTKEHYSEVRDCYNKRSQIYENWYIGAIGFLASYNGRFFDGGYGAFVTRKSTGKTYNAYKEAKDNLLNQDLSGIKFVSGDYEDLIIPEGSLVYCDPPYEGTKQYGINKDFNHEEFWNWVRGLSRYAIVIVSEENAPEDFECIWEQEVQRSMNKDNKYNKVERLFRPCKCF